jgi:inosine/xanthosine triphosphate pyrophosphatase family protein
VVINDTSWSIPALGGFPGAYMHDMVIWLKSSDWLSLMSDKTDKTIFCIENTIFYDGKNYKCFEYRQKGKFITEARGRGSNSMERVTVFANNKTIAEHQDEGGLENSSIELKTWEDFFKWYSEREK